MSPSCPHSRVHGTHPIMPPAARIPHSIRPSSPFARTLKLISGDRVTRHLLLTARSAHAARATVVSAPHALRSLFLSLRGSGRPSLRRLVPVSLSAFGRPFGFQSVGGSHQLGRRQAQCERGLTKLRNRHRHSPSLDARPARTGYAHMLRHVGE